MRSAWVIYGRQLICFGSSPLTEKLISISWLHKQASNPTTKTKTNGAITENRITPYLLALYIIELLKNQPLRKI